MIDEDVIGFLRHVPPFQFLDDTVLENITMGMQMEFFPRGMMILKQDGAASDYLYIIKKGGVKVFRRNSEGEDTVFDFRGEGDLFGYLSLFSGDKSRANVMTVEDTLCYVIKRQTVKRLIDMNEMVREFFLKSFLTIYIDRAFQEMHSRSLYYSGGGDRLLFSTTVGEIAVNEVITAPHDISIKAAAGIMCENKISSVVLADKKGIPVGIVTDRDLRGKVVARGRDVNDPVKDVMSFPILRVDARDYCFEALMKMVRHNVHHLLVVKDGELRGIVTNHDFMILQGSSPLLLAKDIQGQQSIEGLAVIARQVNTIVGKLLKQGARASNITRIITAINDRLVSRILELAERKFGKPPLPYCWIALGSEGRMEQTFKTDQDNGLIYADPPLSHEAETAKGYFGRFAAFVRDGLRACGFPPCAEGCVASNPQWCQPLSEWKRYFTGWISEPTPEVLRDRLIFFDFRGVYGDLSLAENLRSLVLQMQEGQKEFLVQVARLAAGHRLPVGFHKSSVVEKDGEHRAHFDLKVKGIMPLVDIVRLFALQAGSAETMTLKRLDALKGRHALATEYGDELAHIFEFMMLIRIQHQFEQIGRGEEAGDLINPETLSNLQRKTMREAFALLTKLQELIGEDLRGT